MHRNICDKCGSISRDLRGVCAGCGADWPLATGEAPGNHEENKQHLPYEHLRAQIRSAGLGDVRPKQVWVAVTLAILAGPVGLLYCTNTGAVVMLIVSLALRISLGGLSFLIVLPVCAFWAWRAARESASLFD